MGDVGLVSEIDEALPIRRVTNDNWANAFDLGTAGSGFVLGSNVNATVEGSEPNPAARNAYQTVWWKWTAPLDGTLTVDLRGSTNVVDGTELNTVLGIWTGASLAGLSEVDSNDDGPVDSTSRLSVTVTAGTTYYWQVGGWDTDIGFSGTIRLRWFLVGDPPTGWDTSTAPWEWRFTDRGGVARGSILSTDPATVTRTAMQGRDSINAVGTVNWSFPSEHDVNDLLDEDVLAHLYFRGALVTSFIVRSADPIIIDRDGHARELVEWAAQHLLSVWAEGCMHPAGGVNSEPASQDVIFDASHPARDNSDFGPVEAITTVDDAQTSYPLLPYGAGIVNTLDVYVLGPAGTDFTTPNVAGPREWFYDWDAAGGDYIFRTVGDDFYEYRLDGKTIVKESSFGAASVSERIHVTPGVHRLWARIRNSDLPPGTPNPTTFALEGVSVDQAGNETLEVVTNSDWSIWEDVSTRPGWTLGGVLLYCLGLEQNHPTAPTMLGVQASFTADLDSAGNSWESSTDLSAKVLMGLEEVLKGWNADGYGDVDAHWDGANIVLDAWNPGGARTTAPVTLTEGTNIGSLRIPAEHAVMTDAIVELNDGNRLRYVEATVTPTAGHPRKRRGFSKGASRTDDQAIRETNAALAVQGRAKTKPVSGFVYNPDTPDGDLPPNWWKWSRFPISVTTRWTVPNPLEAIAVTFELNPQTGQIDFTPEFGDAMVPLPARAGVVTRRMDPGGLGGQARNSTRLQ